MIEVKNLSKHYGTTVALNGVSFTVEKGEVVGFLGPNGAGKSTTMRILTGALGASGGTASIAGFEVARMPKAAKKQFGYLPEVPPLYPDLRVWEYLEYAAMLRDVPSARRRAAVEKALELCSLTSVSSRIVGRLSKGYQQRVGLAQALVHDPPVLILDEPTIGLDPNQIMGIRQLIKSLAGQHTLILSTHILAEVQMVCDRALIINRGEIVASDTIKNLTSQFGTRQALLLTVRHAPTDALSQLRERFGAEVLEAAESDEGSSSFRLPSYAEEDRREEVAKFAVLAGWGLLELRTERSSLEDVFRSLTTSSGIAVAGEVTA